MSLHTLANHLQSAGRGEDKVLVHMTPGEVNGLQSLAMAHGGSLTINPETGLPEASFLRSLLPTLIGFGLAPFTGGLSAALITGAGYTAATGSLKKGIMAGLGAYGGAGLAGGLNSMGAAAGANTGAGLSTANLGAVNGVNVANTGATIGAQVPSNMVANAANLTDNVALANFRSGLGTNATVGFNPNYTAGSLNAMTPVPSVTAPSVVGPTSAYSPASNFNVGQNLSGKLPYVPPTPTSDGIGDVAIKSFERQQLLANRGDINQVVSKDGLFRGHPSGLSPVVTPSNAVDLSQKTAGTYFRGPVSPGGYAQSAVPVDATVAQTTQAARGPYAEYMSQVGEGAKKVYAGGADGVKALYDAMPSYSVAAGVAGPALSYAEEKREKAEEAMRRARDKSPGMIRPYEFSYGATNTSATPYSGSAEQTYFQPTFTALTPYEAPGPEYAAAGGLMGYAMGGPVENMSNMNAIGANTGYPMASLQTPMYSNPNMQQPEATNVIAPSADVGVGAYTGEQRFAAGGISDLGGYSDGGRLLRGPGDGVSDSIPAAIGNRQPARLADGEFVVPARIVSEIGNGSTEAGARKLYAMMDRVQRARRKTVGKGQVAKNTKAEKLLPA